MSVDVPPSGPHRLSSQHGRDAREIPILVMPGMLGSRRQMRPLMAHLERHGFATQLVPAPARGCLGLERDVEAFSHAIRAHRESTGASRFRLIGHSKGGVAAVVAGIRHRDVVDRVITIASPHCGLGPPWAGRAAASLRNVPQAILDLSAGSLALEAVRADSLDVVSIHTAITDGVTSARAARIQGQRATIVTLRGRGWRGVHQLNVVLDPAVHAAVLDACGGTRTAGHE